MSNKKTLLIIVVIILAVVAFLWWQKSNQFFPQVTPGTATELDQINKDLLDLDISDVDKEFEEIDKDLDTL